MDEAQDRACPRAQDERRDDEISQSVFGELKFLMMSSKD
jgi:hypothetical protein